MGCNSTKDLNPNAARGYLMENFKRHKDGINCMSINDSRTLLVTGGEDTTAKLWKANPLSYLESLEGHAGYVCFCLFSGEYVFTGSMDKTIKKWSVSNYQCLYTYEGHQARVSRLVCSGDFLFSTSEDTTARAWITDTDNGLDRKAACKRIFEGHTKPVFPLIFIPAEDNPLTGKTICVDDILITGSADKTARSWSFQTGKILKIYKGHKDAINCMTADAEAKHLFTGSADNFIRCWNIKTAECVLEMTGHNGAVLELLIHNRMLYSSSVDQTARAWVAEIGDSSKIYRGHTRTVCCLRYFDGYVFTGCTDTVARMYKAKTGECKRVFKGHSNTITAIEVTNERLYTASYDGSIRVWDTTGILDEDISVEDQIKAVEQKQLDEPHNPSNPYD